MLKSLSVAALGLVASLSAAQADGLIYSYPFGPFHAPSISAYDSPSFQRMVEMCARFGVDCSAPGRTQFEPQHDPRLDLPWPEFQDGADDPLDDYVEEWRDWAEELREHYAYRHPGLRADPWGPFGFATPRPLPRFDFTPRAEDLPVLPRIDAPSPWRRPHGALPRGPVIPWPSL